MIISEFYAICKSIEVELEHGEGYTLTVFLSTGSIKGLATTMRHYGEVVEFHKPDRPPYFIDLRSVRCIALES